MTTDNELSELLQSWNTAADAGGDFKRSVWARIGSAESTESIPRNLFLSLGDWIQSFAHPRIAIPAVAIALFGGALIGGLQARSAQEEKYLLSVNPYHANISQLTMR